VNRCLSSFEKLIRILKGNVDINPHALCGSEFLNKNFDAKDSYIIAALADSQFLCENSPNISFIMLYTRK
jgi:hypothetical protein